MPEVIHFRESDAIIKQKDLEADVNITLRYVETILYGTLYKRELTIQALKRMRLAGGGFEHSGWQAISI